jgi:methylglutaconyl-CoA hydratase
MNFVAYHCENRVGFITINRPEKRNALNNELVDELKLAFEIAQNDTDCKVIVLQAAGKVFCAGADLGYIQRLQNNTYEENLADSSHLKELFYNIYTHPKVVIAKIQGHAIAGGCGLATVCDFSFAVPEANFGYTEVQIGFVPAIVMVFLIRKIGESAARELLLSGKIISAEQALHKGMINEIVSSEHLDTRVEEFAQQMNRTNSGQSMSRTKNMIAQVQELSLKDGLAYAESQNAESRATIDCKKGISAFLSKTKIEW